MTDCIICTEKSATWVICAKCNEQSCVKCFQSYLLNSALTPSCMHCKVGLSDEFVINNTKLTWRTKTYKTYKEQKLFDIERSRLPDTQQFAEIYINAKKIVEPAIKEKKKLHEQREELTKQINQCYKEVTPEIIDNNDSYEYKALYEKCRKNERALIKQRNKLKRECQPYNNSLLWYNPTVNSFGLISRNNGEIKKEEPKHTIKACPANGCVAFLDKDFKCGLCDISVCKKCHEICSLEHECNPDIVETIKAIKSQAKSCPKCATLISKIDGCDQMWCTQCHVTFSWRTGLVETGTTHNPHYYEYMRKNGGLPRAPGDTPVNQCNGFPAINHMRNYFNQVDLLAVRVMLRSFDYGGLNEGHKKIFRVMEYHRQITHIDRFHGSGYPVNAPDNHDLRVQYLCKIIDEPTMKIRLQRRDKDYRKSVAKNQIYTMAYAVSGDLFRAFMTNSDMDTLILSLNNLFIYANSCLKQTESQYTCVTKMYRLLEGDAYKFDTAI